MDYAPIATEKARNRLVKKIKKSISFVIHFMYNELQKGDKKMKQTTIRLDSQTLSKIEWIKVYMTDNLPFKTKWTTTDVIKLSIDYRYSKLKELSNK